MPRSLRGRGRSPRRGGPGCRPRGAAIRVALRAALRAAVAALLAAALLPALAAGFDLAALTALLAQRKSGEARFTEERHVAGFDSPLRASGTVGFSAPDRFARHQLEPRPESMVVEGNTLRIERGGRTRTMALDAVPELAAMIEAVRGTFTGNASTLRQHFETRVDGSAAQWTLTLRPRDGRLASQVRELQIVGQGSDPRSVELWLAGGDRSLMTIAPAAR